MFNYRECVLLIVVFIKIVNGDTDCAGITCPKTPKHYNELGCKKVYEDDQCCPFRYECPDIENYDTTVCHFKGKIYNISDEIPYEETVGLCSASCYCDEGSPIDRTAEFRCAQIECGHFFNSELYDCVHQSTLDSCCPNYLCTEPEIKQLGICEFESRTYKTGETIYPNSAPCHKCICTNNFDNSTVANNPDCIEIDCGVELRYLDKFRAGCIPVYYGYDGCCPIEFKCPTEDDIMIPSDNRAIADVTDPSLKCKFGELILDIGDEIRSDDPCDICKCEVPPYAHCTKQKNC